LYHTIYGEQKDLGNNPSTLDIRDTIYLLNTVIPVFFISSASMSPLLKSSGLQEIGSMRLSIFTKDMLLVKIHTQLSLDY